MDLRERLEVIAADYYTKAMAIRTTIELLTQLEGQHINKAEKVKRQAKQYSKTRRYKMSKAKKQEISKRMKAYWKARRANKSNK